MGGAEFVDILCIGSGSAGLAAGVVGADAGLKVLVAESNQDLTESTPRVPTSVESWTTLLQRRWGAAQLNSQTNDYLEELTSSLGPPVPAKANAHLPLDTVETLSEVRLDPADAVPAFCGAELARWARECLTSPFGMLFSRVRQASMIEVRRADGTTITAGRIASVPTSHRGLSTVREWMSELALEKDVTVLGSCSIQRLLFSESQVVGAVLDTPDGARTIRARRGVFLGTSCSSGDESLAMVRGGAGGDTALCIVGRTASRFARLEFLVDAASYGACAPRGRSA